MTMVEALPANYVAVTTESEFLLANSRLLLSTHSTLPVPLTWFRQPRILLQPTLEWRLKAEITLFFCPIFMILLQNYRLRPFKAL
jgi:hypothetical protein